MAGLIRGKSRFRMITYKIMLFLGSANGGEGVSHQLFQSTLYPEKFGRLSSFGERLLWAVPSENWIGLKLLTFLGSS